MLPETGIRRQLFFETKTGASAECERLKARKDNFGVSLNAMTPARIAKASEAYKLLDEQGIDLLDAPPTLGQGISCTEDGGVFLHGLLHR